MSVAFGVELTSKFKKGKERKKEKIKSLTFGFELNLGSHFALRTCRKEDDG